MLVTFGMYDHEEQLENLIALVRESAKQAEPIAMVNLIPKRNIPVIAGEPGSRREYGRSRLQRDIHALLRP